ncbi:hypothetical protein P7K49_035344, partial [Saguinus oedipus]
MPTAPAAFITDLEALGGHAQSTLLPQTMWKPPVLKSGLSIYCGAVQPSEDVTAPASVRSMVDGFAHLGTVL